MADLGSISVSLELDRSRFNRSLIQLEEEAKKAPDSIEQAFHNLGIKSAAHFDLLRQRIETNFEKIKAVAREGSNDILRAEQAKTAQINKLNEEQYGKQLTLIGSLKDGLNSVYPGFAQLVTVTGALTAAIAGAGVVAKASLSYFKELSFQVRDLSYISGGTAEQVSGLLDVVKDFGVEAGAVDRAMVFLSRAIYEGNPTIDRMNLSIRDSNDRLKTAHQMFYEVIDALKNTRSETERNAMAQELFGRGWTAMVPIIEQGAEALRAAAKESQLLFSKEDLAKAEAYRKAITDFGDQIDRIKKLVASEIVVPITIVFKGATQWMEWLIGGQEAAKGAARAAGRAAQREYFGMDLDMGETTAAQAGLWPSGAGKDALTPGELKRAEETRKRMEADQKAQLKLKEEYYMAVLAFEDEVNNIIAKSDQEEMKRLRDEVDERQKLQQTVEQNYIESLWRQAEEELTQAEEVIKRRLELQEQLNRAILQNNRDNQAAYYQSIDDMIEADFQAAQARAGIDADLSDREVRNRERVLNQTTKSFQMGANAMMMLYNATGQKHKEYFQLYKAMAIGEAMITGAQAIVEAYQAGTSIGGPAALATGAAFAAIAAAFVGAQIATIAAQEPGGTGTLNTSAGGSAYAYAAEPVQTVQAQGPRPQEVNIHVYGSYIGDRDTFARDISDSLRKAWEDGA